MPRAGTDGAPALLDALEALALADGVVGGGLAAHHDKEVAATEAAGERGDGVGDRVGGA